LPATTGLTICLRSKGSNAQNLNFGMKKERRSAYEGENKVHFAGKACSALDILMISPWMSKVNGPHDEWAEGQCSSTSGEKSRLRSKSPGRGFE
jgi:hypothetical protein